MEKYNYQQAMRDDVMEYINENYTREELKAHLETRQQEEAFKETLYDDMWICDSVTGNASGSYTFSTWEAEENLCHNLDLLKEALEEFGGDYSKALEEGSEYCDVTIRCYLLSTTIWDCLDIIKDELEDLIECSFCGELYEESELHNGLCPYCQQEMKSRGEE